MASAGGGGGGILLGVMVELPDSDELIRRLHRLRTDGGYFWMDESDETLADIVLTVLDPAALDDQVAKQADLDAKIRASRARREQGEHEGRPTD